MTASKQDYNPWLHRFANLLAAATFCLIFIGGLVTSTGSGLSVPDWPSTYGHFMFSFPLSKMVGGILYEHGHRMVASVVGMLTVVITVWILLKESRKWLKWFAAGALAAVIAQGVLGGITVLYLLPTPVSVLHGCLAQAFFMMTVSMAVFTSKSWIEREKMLLRGNRPAAFNLAVSTTLAVYIQLILGAIMRHSGAGLAIPDFPLAFGRIIPDIASQAIAIHFLHRIGAVVVSVFVLLTVFRIARHHRTQHKLLKPALVLLIALMAQIVLAAFTIWTRKAVLPTTAHVANGAFILATSLTIALRAYLYLEPQEGTLHHNYAIKHAPAS